MGTSHSLTALPSQPWWKPPSSQSLLPSAPHLHSLVMHSALSRHEAPMGLRETPLQNGVILRSRLFAKLSSGTGEPPICRAEANSPPEGRSRPLPSSWALKQGATDQLRLSSTPTACSSWPLPYLAHKQQADHEHRQQLEVPHLAEGRVWAPEDHGEFPLPFIDWCLPWRGCQVRWGKVSICNQDQFNKLMSTRGLCSGVAFQARCID